MKAISLSAVHTSRLYPPRKCSWYSFLSVRSLPYWKLLNFGATSEKNFYVRFLDPFLSIQYEPQPHIINPLKPNNPYKGRTAPLNSKRCILYVYWTNISTEYFKHGIYCPFFSSSKCSLFHNSNVFGFCIFHFYIEDVLKLEK